mgnify:CR=1 FL=1
MIVNDKPGPIRFAQSTFLVIRPPNFVKLAVKMFSLAIKFTATKETIPVVSRVPLSCRLYDKLKRKPKTAGSIATL